MRNMTANSAMSTYEGSELLRRASEWIKNDPDLETRLEMDEFVKTENLDELRKRLTGRLQFGTAGLRGRMGAGYTCMNSLTVIQTSQGLAEYLLTSFPNAKDRGVVIGRDGRTNSEKFASAAAKAFSSMGLTVHQFKGLVHTPLVPFAVTQLGAVAGVMITASHNPKEDNGYKVYWENGCQIIPPHDSFIEEAILRNLELNFGEGAPVNGEGSADRYLPDTILENYVWRIAHQFRFLSSPLAFVYTPLHGVGFEPFTRTFNALNEAYSKNGWLRGDEIPFIAVPKQMEPDGNFPTVKFPNPEEKGALDLARETADAKEISLIVANDPDADRLAIAEKITSRNQPTYWHQFTGDQLGILLASYVMDTTAPAEAGRANAVLRSAVSTEMLDVLAKAHGFFVEETLTGFKWLGNVARSLEKRDIDVRFAFEEALGYMLPNIVYDKDGVAAGALFLKAAAEWRSSSPPMTPFEKLQTLYARHGFFATANTYLTTSSASEVKERFEAIRLHAPEDPHPKYISPDSRSPYPLIRTPNYSPNGATETDDMSARITRWRDLTNSYDSAAPGPSYTPALPSDPSAQMITMWTAAGVKITIRASGTEPKIKFYIEARSTRSMADAQERADMTAKRIMNSWFARDEARDVNMESAAQS